MERLGDQDACTVPTKSRELPHLKMGSSVLKADFDEGDDFYREKTKNELRETPEVVEQALKDFKAMFKDEPDLFVPDDDEFCRKFLRPCKWYPKSAFGLMKRFYKFKVNNPRYCLNLLPSNEKKVLSSDMVIPLPDRMADGCRVLQVNCGKAWNTKIINIDEIFRSIILSLEAAMAEPKTQIAGIHVILNMDGLTLNHVTHITPSFAASVTDWVQRCLPCRLKGIHVVNQPFIFNMVYAIFKPFLLEKTRKRLHFHGTNRDTLLSFIGAKALPMEFGGELEMPNEPIGQGICDYFCWFEKDFEASSKYGYVKSTK
ncbi:alpha-tocopherol transfer protein-like [Bombus pyrosoma]|uniref:alpha-tocopherol transfer protein-like n=1 Tax=Bombus pyrosoma TaxID=396416 RepID=UPI001CB97017|nr:alpha-tocopherol transfer protein-like [Bombus pyrosoma]XP_043594007.1 alpha-tocopherol transfer protein-like [Bombus pyrosoma]XP_043594008.1 alpha-tocopherol transfer protein-like [Bombus pyrosoma]